jgi:glycosyltransferase involved in cell wall biosynthesis
LFGYLCVPVKLPRISIVTPSFNQGPYIEQTIRSVIDQGYPNLEYIVIDGGSTDGTVAVLKKYEKHLAYWVSEPDRGQSDAINKGLAVATGEVFNWLNSDDLLAEGSLARIGSYFAAHPGVDVLCGYCRIFDGPTGATVRQDRMGIRRNAEETLLEPGVNQPSTFFRLRTVRELGGINDHFRYVMDLELWMRYLLANDLHRVRTTDDLLSHFRLHGASKTVGSSSPMQAEELHLYQSLVNAAGLPAHVLAWVHRTYQRTDGPALRPELIARISRKSRQRLARYLVARYLSKFSNQVPAADVREALRYYYRNGGTPANRPLLKTAVKAFLLPAGVLNAYRGLKRRLQPGAKPAP